MTGTGSIIKIQYLGIREENQLKDIGMILKESILAYGVLCTLKRWEKDEEETWNDKTRVDRKVGLSLLLP